MIPEEDELELDEKSGGKGSSLATLSRVSEIPFVPFSVSAGFDVGADKVKEVVEIALLVVVIVELLILVDVSDCSTVVETALGIAEL